MNIHQRVVCSSDPFSEEMPMEFVELGPLGPVGPWYRAQLGGGHHGAVARVVGKWIGQAAAQQFGPEHLLIEGDVVGDEGVRLAQAGQEALQHLVQWLTLGDGAFGGDAMNAGCIGGDGKPLWADDCREGLMLLTLVVGEQPGDLNDARPIGQIGGRCLVVAGQAGGFCIKEQQHGATGVGRFVWLDAAGWDSAERAADKSFPLQVHAAMQMVEVQVAQDWSDGGHSLVVMAPAS